MSRPKAVNLRTLAQRPLPRLDQADDKEGRGQVLVIAGGAAVPGAALLTGRAALRAGAGKLQMAASDAAALSLGLAVPEAAILAVAVTADGEFSDAKGLAAAAREADAIVIGPGLMDEESAGGLACALFEAAPDTAFVVDAAAMTGLELTSASARAPTGGLVLTPHAGEMAKLAGCSKDAVLKDPQGMAARVAESLSAVVVMKGAMTFIATPKGKVFRHTGGVIGLGTSGSGDVLAGIIGGLLARGADPVTAAIWGVWAHGAVGAVLTRRVGPVGFLAGDLLAEIPGVLAPAGKAK
jgi:ADP-dependent NAD(P)H-hydrate dehydratase